jgi:hypothetical protein
MFAATMLLAFPFYIGPGLKQLAWWVDGRVAVAQAMDALELAGVEDVDANISDIGPSRKRDCVVGHIRTGRGTLPFYVGFSGLGTSRTTDEVTVGSETLLPKPPRP